MTDVKDLKSVKASFNLKAQEDLLRAKELRIREARANSAIEKMDELDLLSEELVFTNDYGAVTLKIKEEIEARSHSITFPYAEMDAWIRLSPGSLVAVLASTGSGKSTFVANSAYDLAFRQNKNVLIIVNEESITDVSTRISCLHSGHSIHKFRRGLDAYPQSTLDLISDVSFLNNKISIVDATSFKAKTAAVRSVEGIQKVIEQAKMKYDCIFIDYYQNIDTSQKDPLLSSFQVQERFANYIDLAKNTAKCPIVLMAQIKKGDDDFEQRIKGRKLLMDKCTDVYELSVEKEKSRTSFIVHKDRWGGRQGETTNLGYKDGRLVFYSEAFELEAAEKQRAAIDRQFSNVAIAIEDDSDE